MSTAIVSILEEHTAESQCQPNNLAFLLSSLLAIYYVIIVMCNVVDIYSSYTDHLRFT